MVKDIFYYIFCSCQKKKRFSKIGKNVFLSITSRRMPRRNTFFLLFSTTGRSRILLGFLRLVKKIFIHLFFSARRKQKNDFLPLFYSQQKTFSSKYFLQLVEKKILKIGKNFFFLFLEPVESQLEKCFSTFFYYWQKNSQKMCRKLILYSPQKTRQKKKRFSTFSLRMVEITEIENKQKINSPQPVENPIVNRCFLFLLIFLHYYNN